MIRPGSKENRLRTALAAAGDALIAWGSLALAVAVRRTVPLAFTRKLLPATALPLTLDSALLFAGALVVALGLSGFYRRRILPRDRPLVLAAVVIQGALLAIAGALLERPMPRTILLGVLLLEMVAIPFWRALLRVAFPIRARETILIGGAAQVSAAVAALAAASDSRVRVTGWVLSDAAARPAIGEEPDGVALLGAIDDPAVVPHVRDAEEVIHVGPEASSRSRLDLLRIRGPRGYLLLASQADALLTSSWLGWIGDQPLIDISVGCSFGIRAVVKRSMDLVIGSALTVVALPLGLLTAIAIAVDDRGPVFLRQVRVGRDGVPFRMWKFRSMFAPRPGEVDGEGMTRVGVWLRRYRIDELPQLLNVLTGDMSLVGPRPERPEIVERIVRDLPEFDLRNFVRPGIAGLAQVSGEYHSLPEVKLRYDLTYMCDWSLWLDIRLLLTSVSTSLSGSGF